MAFNYCEWDGVFSEKILGAVHGVGVIRFKSQTDHYGEYLCLLTELLIK
jgi:hypothetical protein